MSWLRNQCTAANGTLADFQISNVEVRISASALKDECKEADHEQQLECQHAGDVAGRADAAADWFEALGYELPRGVNQADYFLDLASGDISTQKIKVSRTLNKRGRKLLNPKPAQASTITGLESNCRTFQ